MSASPYEWEQLHKKEKIENEMNERKKDALKQLSSIIHPEYTEKLGQILAWAFWQDDKEAQKIASEFYFTKMDMAALGDYFDQYMEAAIEERNSYYD